jgi:hypothetical protein
MEEAVEAEDLFYQLFSLGNITDGMKGKVFQCHGESASKQQFLKTVGVLQEHINKTFEYPQDIVSICKKLKTTEIRIPEEIIQDEYNKSMIKKMIWETSMTSYMKPLESNLRAIYAIVWGQCSPSMMQSKLELLDAYSVESTKRACIVWLLKEIQGITHRFEGTRNVSISLDDVWSSYYGYHQGTHQTLHEYLKEYWEHYIRPGIYTTICGNTIHEIHFKMSKNTVANRNHTDVFFGATSINTLQGFY